MSSGKEPGGPCSVYIKRWSPQCIELGLKEGLLQAGCYRSKNKRVLNGGQGRGGHLLPEPHPGVGTGGPCFWRSVADTKEQR